MVNLSIDFKRLLPFVVDAFTKVYGEEYHDIIFQRINNALIIPYYDIIGLNDYISCIKNCKRREYAIEFLNKIGVDVEKYKKNNYMQRLDDEVEKILEYYIGGSYFGFCEDIDYWVPLQAFKPSNVKSPEKLLKKKIKIINYLLGDNHEQITEENFDLFAETEEYHRILEKIDKLNIVYEQFLLEYRKWEEQLHPYEQFEKSETKRKKEIIERKKELLFLDIYSKLPTVIINAISDKSSEEKMNIILGYLDISSVSLIESFSSDKMKKLESKDVSLTDKFFIICWQANFLKNLGLDVMDEFLSYNFCPSEESIDDYLKFLNQSNIKQYIPPDNLISYITSTRESKYEEALREYFMTREDFIDAKGVFSNNDENGLNFIYEIIKNKRTCITNGGAIKNGNEFISVMYYAIRSGDAGSLFYSFMHECGHIIDQVSPIALGFEDFRKVDNNPYDNSFRKYEKFNETINDIFTIEAIELLQKQGIYLIEPLEFTLSDVSNHNTALITKNLLKPLLLKFRQQIINAKVKADHNELIRYIGKDNFEELVDVVNKVDYLFRNGVVSKIDTSPDDEMVKEYFKQVERAKKIYSNIDYYSNNIENLIMTPNNEIEKSR